MEKSKKGRPIERPNTYRFSLYLDGDLKSYIDFIAWKRSSPGSKYSITQYLNDLIRADMEAYLAAGGNANEWTETE